MVLTDTYPRGKVSNPEETTYEYVGGEEGIIIFPGPTEDFRFSQAALRESLAELSQLANTPIAELETGARENFDNIVAALQLLQESSPAVYAIALQHISIVYPASNPAGYPADTVGAFFAGLKPDPPTDLVLHHNGEDFRERPTASTSQHCYIYCTQPYTGLTREEVAYLSSLGIQQVTIAQPADQHISAIGPLPLAEVTLRGQAPPAPVSAAPGVAANSPSSATLFILLLAFIALLVILGLLVVYFVY